MRKIRLLTLIAGAALMLTACGGGGKSAPQRGFEIQDQLGFDQAGITARQSRIEAAIRDCMKAQGFDYVPVDPFSQRAALTGSSRLSDEDFLKQFGYGISTLWGRGGVQANPNERIRASLSSADQAAYDRALYGENPGATFLQAADTGDFTKLGGCTLKATETVFGGAQVLTQLQGKFDSLDQRVVNDQRMVQAIARWSSCMSATGFHYDAPDAIDSDLLKRMEKVVGPLPGKFATGPPPGQTAQPYDQAALAALQQQEVATARADHACELKEIKPVEAVVRPQYEALFRQQNQALISQVKPVG
jgi:hypothetical protein